MLTILGYVLAYAAIGLIAGLVFKTVTPGRSASSVSTYTIIGVISAVIAGLAGYGFLSYTYANSQDKGPGYVAPAGAGNSAVGFDYTGIYLSLIAALFGTLLVLVLYKIMDRTQQANRL